jgi:uncharacterized sporulation protein YeaH/YhbH (DUF444 family)
MPEEFTEEEKKAWTHIMHGIRHENETSKEWVERRQLAARVEAVIKNKIAEVIAKEKELDSTPSSDDTPNIIS